MIRSVYGKTLYQKRFMLMGWFIGVTAVTVLTLSVYNSFSGGELGDSLQNLPPAIQKLAGDTASFKTVGGYISQQIFALRMPVLMTILSIAVLVGVSVGEEEKGLVETQLSLPISRIKLLFQKLLAAWTVIIVASLGSLLGVQIGLWLIGHSYSLLDVVPHLVNCLLVAGGYGLLGFAIGSVTGKRGLAMGAASGLAFLGFLINSMASSVAIFKTADKFTLFHYYQTTGGYNWDHVGLLGGIAVVLICVSLLAFDHRDVRAR